VAGAALTRRYFRCSWLSVTCLCLLSVGCSLHKSRLLSSGTYRRVVRWKQTDVSEEYISIFKIEGLCPSRKPVEWGLLTICFTLVSRLTYSSTLKMEERYSSETSVDFKRTTRHCNPEARTLHNHRSENLKVFIKVVRMRNQKKQTAKWVVSACMW
jgi:hypothetical protein